MSTLREYPHEPETGARGFASKLSSRNGVEYIDSWYRYATVDTWSAYGLIDSVRQNDLNTELNTDLHDCPRPTR